MKTWKTPKGTELTVIDLKGKDYLPVQQRVIWFREEHPKGRIETQIVSHSPASSVCRASIFVLNDKNEYVLLGQGTKSETSQGFADHLEKSETGAIGRALALCGYGTQFTGDELDEASRIVDSPRERVIQPPKHVAPTSTPTHIIKAAPAIQGGLPHGDRIGGPTVAQTKRLYAIAKSNGWSDVDLGVLLKSRFGVESSRDLTKAAYEEICNVILPQGSGMGDPGPQAEPVWESNDQQL